MTRFQVQLKRPNIEPHEGFISVVEALDEDAAKTAAQADARDHLGHTEWDVVSVDPASEWQ